MNGGAWRERAALGLEWLAARLRKPWDWRAPTTISDRAAQAQALRDNALLREAFAHLERSYTAAWRASAPGPDGNEQREALYRCAAAVDQARAHLEQALHTGQGPNDAGLRRLATTKRNQV